MTPERLTNVESVIQKLLFGAMVLSLPFSLKLNSLSIIIFCVYSLWIVWKYRPFKHDIKFLFGQVGLTLVCLIGLVNTTNLDSALRLFETRLPIVVFPFLTFVAGYFWQKQMLRQTLLLFALATIIAGLYIQMDLLFELMDENKPLPFFFYWRNSGSDMSERLGIHATYLSMYVIFSIAIIYEFVAMKELFSLRSLVAFCLITYLVVLLLHLASRVSLVIAILAIGLVLANSIKRYKWQSLFLILPLFTLFWFLFNLELFAIKSRLENNMGNPFDFKGSIESGSYDQRIVAWHGAYGIIKNNFLIGVGTGDATQELNKAYILFGAPDLAEKNLNSHNQYLDAILRNGILGLLGIFGLYFIGIWLLRSRPIVYTIFILTISVTSLTENIIDRQKGAVFVGLFNCILFAYYTDPTKGQMRKPFNLMMKDESKEP